MKKTKSETAGKMKVRRKIFFIVLLAFGLLFLKAKTQDENLYMIFGWPIFLEASIDSQANQLAERVEKKIEESRKIARGGN